jgi:DNA mismatch repair protein MutS2
MKFMLQKLFDKSLRALEYFKILELLAEKCSCEDSTHLAMSLLPFTEPNDVRKHLDETSDACRLSLRFGAASFMGLKDVSSALYRAKIGSSLTTKELLDVASILSVLRSLSKYRTTSQSFDTCLSEMFDTIAPNKYLEDKINAAILSEEEIADSASPELSDIRRHIRHNGTKVREQLDKMIHSSAYQKYLQEPIVTMRNGRFVVPVKSECRSDIPGLVHDTSASGATVFIEPMSVVESNNELKVLYSKEEKEIERILAALSSEVGGFSETIAQSYEQAVLLDFIFAKSRLAFAMKAFAPKIDESGKIFLNNARHPLIEQKKAVPISIMLGDAFNVLVITGPNTGGKTVALKTLGLLTLMTMSGLMIPADETSSVGCFQAVLADIGDEQSIEQSLSTFSAHMTNIVDILAESDEKSLVLLDELGSGTDPIEGAALATSILEYLLQNGSKVAATTHYAELKAFALQKDGVENACCEFDVETLKPTFKLLIGVPGRSNAFAISQRLGLSLEIIERAKELVSTENARFEDVVQSLEDSRQQMEQQKEQCERLRIDAEKVLYQAEQQKQEIDDSQMKELEKARAQAKRILDDTRLQAQLLLSEIDDLKKQKNSEDITSLSHQAKLQLNARLRSLEAAADPVSGNDQPNYKLPRTLKAGDTVLITAINKKGVVITPEDNSGYVEVQAGIIRTKVQLTELRLLNEKLQQVSYHTKTNIDKSQKTVKSEFDMRGQNVEEGLLELDRFIDDAQITGLSLVTVIHGKGTGVLRTAVQQHLKNHKSVKSFRLGKYGEGETGVTIVELN